MANKNQQVKDIEINKNCFILNFAIYMYYIFKIFIWI